MLGFSHCREKAYRITPVDMIAAMSRNRPKFPSSPPETISDHKEPSR